MTELDEALKLDKLLLRERPFLEKNDAYFEGEQPLKFVSATLERELHYRLSPVVLNLARYAVDVYENRLDIESFRLGGAEESDSELQEVWEANDGPYLAQQSHRESLALGRAYAMVGPGETPSDAPTLTIESAFDAIHQDDPRTHQVRHGMKRWTDPDKVRWMTYFDTEVTVTWRRDRREWVEEERSDSFGVCPIVPLMNDPRLLGRAKQGRADQRLGRSVFHDILSPMDALNKIAYDMMTSSEFHGLPRRWATGLLATDFVDENGKDLETFSLIAGRIWGTSSKEARFGQFPEAALSNFHDTINLLWERAGQLLGLPPHYTARSGQNPTSADAIRSAESQLVKRAERKQQVLSTSWERVQRLVMLNLGYPDGPELRNIETQWRDPATPTIAQKADAIVKLVQARDESGRSILPIEQAREDLGYTSLEQGRMADWDAARPADPTLAAAGRELNQIGAT